MAVYYRPMGGVPPWVLELMEVVGLDQAINVLRARATAANLLSDTTDATALTNMVSTLQSSGAFTGSHGVSARNSIMVIRKA
jgi:hypothetical protein